jgi:hypothetical protein
MGDSGSADTGASAPPPSYDADIKPKFRPQDISCMARHHISLGNAAWMCDPAPGAGFDDHANARRVFAALSAGTMPPDGAWQPDWLTTFQNWMDAGFQP